MNLKINGYKENNKIYNKNYICKNHGGNSKLPKISWEKIDKAESYALILEDIDANNYIHLYIPYINPNIQKIEDINIENMNRLKNKMFHLTNNDLSKINVLFGKNYKDYFGFFGPCAPKNTGIHRYVFRLYALDSILQINDDTIKIQSSNDFENKLKNHNIHIITKTNFTLKYEF